MCSIVMSVRLSTWNNMATGGRILIKFDICLFFKNLSGKFKFHSNLMVLQIKSYIHFYNISLNSLIINVIPTKVVEEIKTHIYIQKVQKSFLLWNNVEKYSTRGQSSGMNMAHAYYALDPNILSKYIIIVVSKAKLFALTRLNRTFYIHTLIVQSNFYLHLQFTPQRTQRDFIRKSRRSVCCKNWKEIINKVYQNTLFYC